MNRDLKSDTIAAIATPRGRGGVGIIRVSGPLVSRLAQQLIGSLPNPRVAQYTKFKDLFFTSAFSTSKQKKQQRFIS